MKILSLSNSDMVNNLQNSAPGFKQNTVFKGMTKQLKKRIYIDGQKNIKEIIDNRKDKNLIVGQLPKFILNKLPKENLGNSIKEFYQVFDKISEELRQFNERNARTIEEIQKRRYQSTQQLLDNLLRKYNLIGKFDDADIIYINKGGKGAGYRIIGLRGQDTAL